MRERDIRTILANARVVFDNDPVSSSEKPSWYGMTTGRDMGWPDGSITEKDIQKMFISLCIRKDYPVSEIVLGVPSGVTCQNTWLQVAEFKTLKVDNRRGHILLYSKSDGQAVVARNVVLAVDEGGSGPSEAPRRQSLFAKLRHVWRSLISLQQPNPCFS